MNKKLSKLIHDVKRSADGSHSVNLIMLFVEACCQPLRDEIADLQRYKNEKRALLEALNLPSKVCWGEILQAIQRLTAERDALRERNEILSDVLSEFNQQDVGEATVKAEKARAALSEKALTPPAKETP